MSKVGKNPVLTNNPIALTGTGVFTQARVVSRSVTEIFDNVLRAFGMSSVQFVLLSLISQAGPITRAEIARIQDLEKSTLTRNLRTLLSEGWVEEVHEGANGRNRPIGITAAGEELLIKAQSAWLAAQESAMALLGKDGMMALKSIADRVTNKSYRIESLPQIAL